MPGSAVFLSSSKDAVPPALLNNVEHNHVVHEQVVLLTVEMRGRPARGGARPGADQRLRLGFVGITARYGYQDEPDVPAAMRLAQAQGLEIDLDHASYYVNHVSLIPTGDAPMAGWRTRLFALLHQNSTPAARYFHIPPDRVFEVGVYVPI